MQSIFRNTYIWIFCVALLLCSCNNFTKEVEIKLPEFKSQLVIEAYIEDNKPIKVALTETQNYFDTLKNPFVEIANVIFSYNGNSYKLGKNFPDIRNRKYFNFALNDSFHFQEGDMVYISVKDINNRMANAQSRWINPVKLDSIGFSYNQKEQALITAHFKDPINARNFYRFRVVNLSDSNKVKQDFFTDDATINGTKTAFGTGFNFKKGDSLEISLFNIPQDFYTFLETANAAIGSNGNPFAQPAVIKSNVTGGSGIFTVVPYDRKIFVLP
ncbi:MAG: DUF4249 domain-containing protein [Sphingobacteriales bacterium]|nr:MAG: DUF4249 domain-containing protein [Sphingobacteriales bacterium]